MHLVERRQLHAHVLLERRELARALGRLGHQAARGLRGAGRFLLGLFFRRELVQALGRRVVLRALLLVRVALVAQLREPLRVLVELGLRGGRLRRRRRRGGRGGLSTGLRGIRRGSFGLGRRRGGFGGGGPAAVSAAGGGGFNELADLLLDRAALLLVGVALGPELGEPRGIGIARGGRGRVLRIAVLLRRGLRVGESFCEDFIGAGLDLGGCFAACVVGHFLGLKGD